MTGIVGRVKDALRGGRVDADTLIARLDALGRFVSAAEGRLPAEPLAPAERLVGRADERLRLSRDHTVVALAGSTGSGKSSLFNALAGVPLSTVGVRRPTTGVVHACVWGEATAAAGLLDWIGIGSGHRFVHQGDQDALTGLVLLDLPDFDSVAAAHREEVDRVLGLVDLVVWVVDPQKYADRLVHRAYLQEFRRHRDVTIVVLNQVDRLRTPADVNRILGDLRDLLAQDGLDGVPVLAASAVVEDGRAVLQSALAKAVSARMAALRRLSADVDTVVADLIPLVPGDVRGDGLDRASVERLSTALGGLAGVPAVLAATKLAYRHRAMSAMGWPVVRWWRKLRPDPLRRLHLSTGGGVGAGVTSLAAPDAAAQSQASLAIRSVTDKAREGLPAPWQPAINAAARSREADLPDALDRAIAGTDLGIKRYPFWWRVIALVQWLVTLAALAGLLWLVVGYVLRALGLPAVDQPKVGLVPMSTLLLIGGLAAGLVIGLLVRIVVGWASSRARNRADRRLRARVSVVAEEYVVAPVREVRSAYREAAEALALARR